MILVYKIKNKELFQLSRAYFKHSRYEIADNIIEKEILLRYPSKNDKLLSSLEFIQLRILIMIKQKRYEDALKLLDPNKNDIISDIIKKELINTLCPPTFDAIPYKLPSEKVQTILIDFWAKHSEYMPNDISFRTMYLLRWICVLSFEFDDNILNKLLNIMTAKFDNRNISDTSESVLMLFSILAFLGGSTISTCDNHSR